MLKQVLNARDIDMSGSLSKPSVKAHKGASFLYTPQEHHRSMNSTQKSSY